MIAKKIGEINSSLITELHSQNIKLNEDLIPIRWFECVVLGRIKSIMRGMYETYDP